MNTYLKIKQWAVLFVFLGLPLVGLCGKDPFKLGTVTEAELKMTSYSKDTAASAVVLFDYGESSFLFNEGTQVQFKRIMRIKILKKNGLGEADFIIPFYKSGGEAKENITQLQGITYNLENGTTTKVKLDSKSVFEEKQDKNWYLKKLTMPNAKVGSVLEITYTIKSDYIENLREWEFQKTIPVLYSEYRVNMVPFFTYTHLLHGFLPFHSKDAKILHQTASIRYTDDIGLSKVERAGTISMSVIQYTWVMKDVPAFAEEPYLASADDYLSKMEFMLTKIQYPDQNPTLTTGTWEGLANKLQKEEMFGGQLASSHFLKKTIEGLQLAALPDTLAKVKAVLAYVQKQMTWNGQNRVYAEDIKKAHDAQKGSSAEINLLLTALLREAGLPAYPMLISTRRHGKPVTNSPMMSKFNYVLAHVAVGKNTYLLDATEQDLPFGMLPFRCLNEQGWVSQLPSGKWVPLKNADRNVQMVTAQMEIKPTGQVTGKMEETFSGLSALQARSFIREKGQENFLKDVAARNHDWVREEMKVSNLTSLQDPLKTSYTISSATENEASQLLYLSPMLSHATRENPFKVEDRKYPIDFASPVDETYLFTFKLPAGYELEEMPKSLDLSIPGNGAKFTYLVQVIGGDLQVISKLNINKATFNPSEYGYLREFYSQMVAKHAEKIVLRKKS